jgi:FkbM family methyltransferase
MNIFIDCGTHLGQGLRSFIEKFEMNESWSIHTFEANPITYKIYAKNYHRQNEYVRFYNVALSGFDGATDINVETPPGEGETGQGSSIIDLERWNPWGGSPRKNFLTSYRIPCWSLSRFIKENFNKDDRIVIKMDIEGSEYDALEKMIEEGTIEWVDHIFIEFHSRFFTNKSEVLKRENSIVEKIKSIEIKFEGWV